jgi:hypothetical protein
MKNLLAIFIITFTFTGCGFEKDTSQNFEYESEEKTYVQKITNTVNEHSNDLVIETIDGDVNISIKDGVGIESIHRTSGDGSAGTSDIHTITFTDGNQSAFEVTHGINGVDGVDGQDGINGANGSDGTDGIGIQSVSRTSGDGSEGTIDVYAMTMTNGTITEFSVWNGTDGDKGESAYDVAVNNGFVGTEAEWLQSLKGDDMVFEESLDGAIADVNTSLENKVDKVASSTDNTIVRFNGTSGAIQNSGIIIDDANNLITSKLKLQDGNQGQDKILVSDANGQASWVTSPALKEHTKDIPLSGKVIGDYVEVFSFSRSALQGIFEIYMLVSGGGYGTTTKFVLPVTYNNDYMSVYYGANPPADTWHDVTPQIFSGRHLLREQNGVKLQMKVKGNTLYLRVIVGKNLRLSPTAQFSIRHNANFEGYTITDLTANTGNDLTVAPVFNPIVTAPYGTTDLFGDVRIKKAHPSYGDESANMTIEENLIVEGNVGIGVTSPSEKLEVSGTIKATSINFSGLPTSADGLSSGDVWNNAGVLNIVP